MFFDFNLPLKQTQPKFLIFVASELLGVKIEESKTN